MKKLKRSYQWYAMYTRSRTEKKVKEELDQRGVEVYLPLQKTLRQWSDRKKWVEVPLISGYVFVKVSEREYYDVLNSNGAVCYVTFEGKAAPIPDCQIEGIKRMLHDGLEVEVSREEIATGDMIEVIAGPFIGMKGEVVRFQGKHRLIIRLAPLGCVLMTEIKWEDVKKGAKV